MVHLGPFDGRVLTDANRLQDLDTTAATLCVYTTVREVLCRPDDLVDHGFRVRAVNRDCGNRSFFESRAVRLAATMRIATDRQRDFRRIACQLRPHVFKDSLKDAFLIRPNVEMRRIKVRRRIMLSTRLTKHAADNLRHLVGRPHILVDVGEPTLRIVPAFLKA